MASDGDRPRRPHRTRAADRLLALPDRVRAAFGRVDAVVMDCDGVLTDGRVHLLGGGAEAFSFHIRDVSALWQLHKAGVRTGVVTGRSTGIPESHAGTLRFDAFRAGRLAKEEALREMLAEWGLPPERCAYVGDDVLDGPALRLAGLPVCVADAEPDVLPLALYVTERRGGRGALREVADLVLEARGDRGPLLDALLGPRGAP